MNEDDINAFVSNQRERAKIIKCPCNHELEMLTLLALRMKALDMKPSDWYKMIAKSPTQQSVTVCDVRESLAKLNIGMGDSVEILKILDENTNFFVEQEEITRIFGSKI